MYFYLVSVAYDGSEFAGWARQPNKFTVQGYIETVLSKIFQRKIDILSASRTDKGVHAHDQNFTLQLEWFFSEKKLLNLLKKLLKKYPIPTLFQILKQIPTSKNAAMFEDDSPEPWLTISFYISFLMARKATGLFWGVPSSRVRRPYQGTGQTRTRTRIIRHGNTARSRKKPYYTSQAVLLAVFYAVLVYTACQFFTHHGYGVRHGWGHHGYGFGTGSQRRSLLNLGRIIFRQLF